MDRQIIINADDFGLCEGVNRAVVKAHREGVLTSATIMANMPAAEEAVKLAKQNPSLGVGVHLNLFKGIPLSKEAFIDSLVDEEGRFACSIFKLSLLSIVIHKFRNAIKAELSAQIQWVIDNGLKPTHLDSHKHIHSFPAIYPMVCELAKRFAISAVRWPYEPKQASKVPWPLPVEGGRKAAMQLRTMAKINRVQDSRLIKTKALLGVAHLGKIDENFFKAVSLYNTESVAEVMTHPGFADGIDPQQTSMVRQREIELNALCSDKTKEYLNKAGIKLVHFGELGQD